MLNGTDTKHCAGCKTTKPVTDFWKCRSKPDGLQTYCKPCQGQRRVHDPVKQRVYSQRYSKNNPDYRVDWTLQLRYGITLDDYRALLHQQNGTCAICGTPPDHRRLHVDHDHETGKVRGLLCGSCNLGLGKFDDDIARLENAIAYLRSC